MPVLTVMQKVFITIATWLVLSLSLSILEYKTLAVYVLDHVQFAHFLIMGICLAFCGGVIQGLFIKNQYFELSATDSVLFIGTLTLLSALLLIFLLPILDTEVKVFWADIELLFIPSYLITGISYYFSLRF